MQLLSDSDVLKKYHDQIISVFTSGASREEEEEEAAETKIKKILGKKNADYADAAPKCYKID